MVFGATPKQNTKRIEQIREEVDEISVNLSELNKKLSSTIRKINEMSQVVDKNSENIDSKASITQSNRLHKWLETLSYFGEKSSKNYLHRVIEQLLHGEEATFFIPHNSASMGSRHVKPMTFVEIQNKIFDEASRRLKLCEKHDKLPVIVSQKFVTTSSGLWVTFLYRASRW